MTLATDTNPENARKASDDAASGRPWQFSLRSLLAVNTGWSLILALLVTFPIVGFFVLQFGVVVLLNVAAFLACCIAFLGCIAVALPIALLLWGSPSRSRPEHVNSRTTDSPAAATHEAPLDA